MESRPEHELPGFARMALSYSDRWREHLAKNNMTYVGHFCFAAGHGVRCLRAACYLIVHAFMPCFYRHAGSRLVRRMEKDFTDHRQGVP